MIKQIKLKDLPAGETFTLWGRSFTVLEQYRDRTFVLAAEVTAEAPFATRRKEVGEKINFNPQAYIPNNFKYSYIRKFLGSVYYDELIEDGNCAKSDILPLGIDLKCTMGEHEYEYVTVNIGLLTLEQYGKFYDIIPRIEEDWWLATPYKTPSYSAESGADEIVWHVNSKGHCKPSSCFIRCGLRPTLNLDPYLIVAWEDGNIDRRKI